MANPNASGQKKLHTVTNPSTGESREITQEQWRNRKTDSSLAGFERPDDSDLQDEEAPASEDTGIQG